MKFNVKYWITTFLFLSFPSVCLANPVGLYRAGTGTTLLVVFGINIIVDLSVLLLSFFMIKKFFMVKSWKFLLYFIIVLTGGFIIDEFLFLIGVPFISNSVSSAGITCAFLLGFLALYYFNLILPKGFFVLSKRERMVIAILIGIITNPILYGLYRDSLFNHYRSANWSEGMASMGTIATGIRAYVASDPNGFPPITFDDLGFKQGDFDGTYFRDTDFLFFVKSMTPLRFVVLAQPSSDYNWRPEAKTLSYDSIGYMGSFIEIKNITHYISYYMNAYDPQY